MSHRWSRVAVTVIAAIVATSTLAACSPDRAEAGSKIYSRTVIEGSRSTVQLPTGSLDLVVSRPRSELTDREAKPRSAPDGGSFVGLSWELRRAETTKSNAYTVRRQPLAAEVTLISDGKRYPVGKPYDAVHKVGDETRSSSWWVAVDGGGQSLKIEVAYHGELQVVDVAKGDIETGRAAPLYVPAKVAPVASPCKPIEPSGPIPRPEFDSFTCDVEVLGIAPYVDQVGWARPGRTWAIVSVSTAVFGPITWRTSTDRIEYDGIDTGVWAVDVDGKVASPIIDHSKGDNGRGNAVVAVDVPVDGDAQLVLRTSYRSGEATSQPQTEAPETVGVSFTRKLQLTY